MFFLSFGSASGDIKNKELEQYYQLYKDDMFRMALSILHNTYDSEEAVQEVFLKLVRRHQKFWEITDQAARKNYLLASVKNTAINMVRKSRKNVSLDEMREIKEMGRLMDLDFEETILTHYEYEQTLKAIQKLDYIYQEVMYYHFGLGLTIRETAKIVGRSPGTVNIQLVRGKKKLLKIMRKEERI